MKKERFILTNEQQEVLRANKYVQKCSAHSIGYTAEFKRHVLHEYTAGKKPRDIFTAAGIPIEYFGKDYARERISAWQRITKKHGDKRFDTEHRGNKGKNIRDYHDRTKLLASLSKDETIAFYQAENEMLRFAHRSFTLPQALIFLQDYRLGQKESLCNPASPSPSV